MRLPTLLLFSAFALASCQTKAMKVQHLQDEYNAQYAAYSKDCLEEDNSGAARLLTGQKLTSKEATALEAKKKARETRCKPQSDKLAEIQRKILAVQQE
jgi:hypothetical protein